MKHIVKLIVENRGSLPDYVAQLSFVFRDAISILPFCMDDPDAYTPPKRGGRFDFRLLRNGFSRVEKDPSAGPAADPH